jgi:hypothetical protein
MTKVADPLLLLGYVRLAVRHPLKLRFMSLIMSAFLSACGLGPSPNPTSLPGQVTPPGDAYPAVANVTQDQAGVTADIFRTPEVDTNLPAPTAGKAVLGGSLYSFTTKVLVPDTLVYLTPAVGQDHDVVPAIITGPDEAQGDVRGQSNMGGQFVIIDIPPGNYFLVVATPLNWVVAVTDEGSKTPLLIELTADKTKSLGVVYLSWP